MSDQINEFLKELKGDIIANHLGGNRYQFFHVAPDWESEPRVTAINLKIFNILVKDESINVDLYLSNTHARMAYLGFTEISPQEAFYRAGIKRKINFVDGNN